MLNGRSAVGFSWVSLLAFLRPTSTLLEPTAQHLEVLSNLLTPLGAGGNLIHDAHLAALAIQHRGEVITYDSDFGRLRSLSGRLWSRPGALEIPREQGEGSG